jgi:hypothetical protein
MRHMTWRSWTLGLIDASLNSAASAVAVTVVDPEDFNVGAGLGKLGSVMLVSFVVGGALYIKSHRLPGVDE